MMIATRVVMVFKTTSSGNNKTFLIHGNIYIYISHEIFKFKIPCLNKTLSARTKKINLNLMCSKIRITDL
jgi:hypothetical protein